MDASSTEIRTGARDGLAVVVGGTGFVGSSIVRHLLDDGWRVAVVSRHPESVPDRLPGLDVEAREGDITRPDTLDSALQGARLVVQAAQFPGSPVEDPSRGWTFMEVDARGTEAVAAAAADAGTERLLYLSGVGADPDAARHWFRAKARAERAVRESGVSWSVIRPSWVYGPDDVSLNRFVDILRRVPLVFPQLGDGRQKINPVFIEDVGRLSAAVVASSDAAGETIEIGGPEIYTMDAILRVVMDAIGRKKMIVHTPLWLLRPVGELLEWAPGQLLSRDAIDFITQSAIADLSALRRLFPNLHPRPLREALGTYLGRAGERGAGSS